MKIHITHTGYYAGEPICGINKQGAKRKGDKFAHLGSWIFNPLVRRKLCSECRRIFDLVDERCNS